MLTTLASSNSRQGGIRVAALRTDRHRLWNYDAARGENPQEKIDALFRVIDRYSEEFEFKLIMVAPLTFNIFNYNRYFQPQTRVPVPDRGSMFHFAGHLSRPGAQPSIPIMKINFVPEKELLLAYQEPGNWQSEEYYMRLELRNLVL